jgi:hypothetical protein
MSRETFIDTTQLEKPIFLISNCNTEETILCGIFFTLPNYDTEKSNKENDDFEGRINELIVKIINDFESSYKDNLTKELTEKLIKIKETIEKDYEKAHQDIIDNFKSFYKNVNNILN